MAGDHQAAGRVTGVGPAVPPADGVGPIRDHQTAVVGHELGYKDMTELVWIGLWTTPDMPEAVQAKVRNATLQALKEPKLRDNLATIGMSVGTGATPDQLMASLRAASDKQG